MRWLVSWRREGLNGQFSTRPSTLASFRYRSILLTVSKHLKRGAIGGEIRTEFSAGLIGEVIVRSQIVNGPYNFPLVSILVESHGTQI